MFGEFLQSSTLGLASIVDVIGQSMGSIPWEGPWVKVKAIVNLISLIITIALLLYIIYAVVKKYILDPKKGIEPVWTNSEIGWTGAAAFFALVIGTPLGGAFIGKIILFFIG